MIGNFPQKYSYSWFNKAGYYFFAILLAILSLFFGLELIINLILWPFGRLIEGNDVIVLTFSVFITGFLASLFSNIDPNIEVGDKGLKVQVFLFWWIFVPWTDIEDTWVVGVFAKWQPVVVRKLTPFHRIIGLSFGSLKPVFPIRPTLNGYNELVRIIEQNIGKTNNLD